MSTPKRASKVLRSHAAYSESTTVKEHAALIKKDDWPDGWRF